MCKVYSLYAIDIITDDEEINLPILGYQQFSEDIETHCKRLLGVMIDLIPRGCVFLIISNDSVKADQGYNLFLQLLLFVIQLLWS